MEEKQSKIIEYRGLKFNPAYSLHTGIYPTVRPIENLRWIEHEDGETKSYTYKSDVSLLLNSERIINEIGEDAYRMIIKSMQVPSVRYDMGKHSDDEMLSTVKSRFCQTPSEIRTWLNTWREEAQNYQDAFVAAKKKAEEERLQKLAEQQAADQQQQQQQSSQNE